MIFPRIWNSFTMILGLTCAFLAGVNMGRGCRHDADQATIGEADGWCGMSDSTNTVREITRHKFNARLFCDECGVDAIGLKAWGAKAMECPFTKYAEAK